MSFLSTTHNINISAPINQLGYGLTGLNLSLALHELKNSVALFSIGQLEAPPKYHEDLKQLMSNSRFPDFNAPSVRIWHQHDMTQFVGKGATFGFPIFELDTFTDLEKHHLHWLDNWM